MSGELFPVGGPTYQRHLADLARRAKDAGARPNQDPMRDWTPPYARNAAPEAKPAPQVVSEVPDPYDDREDATFVIYDDGSVVRRWTEFSRFTERVETYFEDVI